MHMLIFIFTYRVPGTRWWTESWNSSSFFVFFVNLWSRDFLSQQCLEGKRCIKWLQLTFWRNNIRKWDWSWIAKEIKNLFFTLRHKSVNYVLSTGKSWLCREVRRSDRLTETKQKTVGQWCRDDDGCRPARPSRTSNQHTCLKSIDCLFCWTSSNVCHTTSPPCCICKLNK